MSPHSYGNIIVFNPILILFFHFQLRISIRMLLMPAVSCVGMHNTTIWCPSVCPISILTVTHQGAACDAASIHFGPTMQTHTCFYVKFCVTLVSDVVKKTLTRRRSRIPCVVVEKITTRRREGVGVVVEKN